MNKNRKGFTLVELIVVVTIFGVILGAILNMICLLYTSPSPRDTR